MSNIDIHAINVVFSFCLSSDYLVKIKKRRTQE